MHPPLNNRNDTFHSQKGAVLVVSLVLLLVMTLIGITGMRSANVDEKMAANSMNKNISFQASESAVDGAIASVSTLEQAINSGGIVTFSVDMGDTSISASAAIDYLGTGIAPGYSLGENEGSFMNYRYDIIGTGNVTAANAQTVTAQGIWRIAPGG